MTMSLDAPTWERMMAALTEQAEPEPEPVYDASEAPYKIFRQGAQWVVKNNANMVKAKFGTRQAALKYLRALYANVPGAAKKADQTKWSGKAPKPKKAA
jgi:hypothetical protein